MDDILQYFLDSRRILLICSWCLLVLSSILWCFIAGALRLPVCIKRKFFHFIISAIFISGIIYDHSFLFVASIGALSAFFVSEIIRLRGPRKLSDTISHAIAPFLDSKDNGVIIWSHIFLLAGLSLPLWIDLCASKFRIHSVVSYAGVVTVGIGDSFAAVIGSSWGRRRWKGRNRTLEGSAAMFTAEMLSFELLGLLDPVIFVDNAMRRRVVFFFNCLFTTAAEAWLRGSDNVLIPLLSVILLWPLRQSENVI